MDLVTVSSLEQEARMPSEESFRKAVWKEKVDIYVAADRQRLEHIRDYCIEIKKTIIRYGESFEAFDSDADYQRSVSFCILQIGELSGGLSVEFRKATADRIQWGPIKGMRNLVAHSYGSMSRDIIWETAVTDIPVLQEFCEQQLMAEDQK